MCDVFFQSLLLVSGQPPTSHPPRGLTSAAFTSTHSSWLAHTESWLASWRAHAPSHGSHGVSPVRCLWQLQDHRKFTAGETQNVREEAPAVATLSGAPPKGTGKLRVSTDRTLTPPGSASAAGGSHVTYLTPALPPSPAPHRLEPELSALVHQNLWGGTKVGYLCFFKFSRCLLCAHGVEGRHLGK